LVAYFICTPERLKEEGLFRKSVSIDDINEASLELYKGNYEFINEIDNPHLVASI
jgi:hypothetical protein